MCSSCGDGRQRGENGSARCNTVVTAEGQLTQYLALCSAIYILTCTAASSLGRYWDSVNVPILMEPGGNIGRVRVWCVYTAFRQRQWRVT